MTHGSGTPAHDASSHSAQGDSRTALIRVDSLSVPQRLAPLTFAVHAGEALALTGDNGAGKTTALEALAGRRPFEGSVLMDGREPDRARSDFRALLAAAIGTPDLDPALTVTEHLTTIAMTWGQDAAQASASATHVLADLRVSQIAERQPLGMSSGQQQLFELALTLIRPARVLLLDEPEKRLSLQSLRLLAGVLRRRRESGAAVVVTTHSPDLVSLLGARTVPVSPLPVSVS